VQYTEWSKISQVGAVYSWFIISRVGAADRVVHNHEAVGP